MNKIDWEEFKRCLTPRERQIWGLIQESKSREEIVAALGISLRQYHYDWESIVLKGKKYFENY